MSLLEKINRSDDIKKLNRAQLNTLTDEIREKIIDTVSANGGHLASNLGIVELTVALHRVFDFPSDSLIFDVGHQCYVHKLLTGRQKEFSTLRQCGGISGFPLINESEYDAFGAGHSGTSVSAALGIAVANKLDRTDNYAVAVVGDGSFTNGMIYEALNNCPEKDLKLIIILNDNEMSISKNVGAMSRYLSKASNTRVYIKFKNKVYAISHKTSIFGKALLNVGKAVKNTIKRIFMNKNYFECLGLKYFGPIDGHNTELLEMVLHEAKKKNAPCIVHVTTQKGKGYTHAEQRPDLYHSVGAFDKETGLKEAKKQDFSSVFGDILTEQAGKDKNICAVTAAMGYGTGLAGFIEKYPDRFFDVGIAEEHALTFCAGLAAAGKKPVFAVYSSFLQRCYDQLIHDVSIQNLPVVIAIDRSGFVPQDGITHQGVFDCSFLKAIPNFEIYTPETYGELKQAFQDALKANSPVAIRYPKGQETIYDRSAFSKADDSILYCDMGQESKKVTVITYGRITYNALKAAELLKNDCSVRIIKLLKIKPLDFGTIKKLADGSNLVLILEEGIMSGGIGEEAAAFFAALPSPMPCIIHALDDEYAHHGTIDDLYTLFGFSPEKLADKIKSKL